MYFKDSYCTFLFQRIKQKSFIQYLLKLSWLELLSLKDVLGKREKPGKDKFYTFTPGSRLKQQS